MREQLITKNDRRYLWRHSPFAKLAAMTDSLNDEQLEFLDMVLPMEKFVGRSFRTIPALYQAITKPHEPTMNLVRQLRAELEHAVKIPSLTQIVKQKVWGWEAGEICADRLLHGQDCLRRIRRRVIPAANPKVTLAVVVHGSFSLTPEQLAWRGVIANVLTSILQQAQFRVRLVGCIHLEKSLRSPESLGEFDLDALLTFTIKDHAEPFDYVNCCNAVDAWFFRTVGLAMLTSNPDYHAEEEFGSPAELRADQLDLIAGEDHRLLVDDVFDQESAVEFITSATDQFRQAA